MPAASSFAAVGGGASLGIGKLEGDLAWSRQKRMMQKRHQWEVKDLRKAGLNPILSAGGAPSMASPQPARLPDLQQSSGNITKEKTNKEQRSLLQAQTKNVREQSYNAAITGELLSYQLPGAKLEADISSAKHTAWARNIKEWLPIIGTATGAIGVGRAGKLLRGGAAPKTPTPNPGPSRWQGPLPKGSRIP